MSEMPSSLKEAILESLVQGSKPKPLPEAIIMELRQREKWFAASVDHGFKPGDIVTPRPGGSMRWAGDPTIVVEVLEDAPRNWATEPASDSYGEKPQIRVVARAPSGQYLCFTREAWMFERYRGAGVD